MSSPYIWKNLGGKERTEAMKVDEKFKKYMKGILKYNESINLTAITDEEEFIIKHYYDSLVVMKLEEYKRAKRIVDIGTGAGFPGIPLAIHSQDKEFVLVDSLKKRLKIIDELCDSIGIHNVKTVHGRAEELGKNSSYRESFDLCVSRAVASLEVLAEYTLPFIKKGGWLMAYKGPDCEKELESGKKAISILGGEIKDVVTGNMEEYGIYHNIVLIKKIKPTPAGFPRKPGIPTKEPIK